VLSSERQTVGVLSRDGDAQPGVEPATFCVQPKIPAIWKDADIEQLYW
jgi:hypothetical protein